VSSLPAARPRLADPPLKHTPLAKAHGSGSPREERVGPSRGSSQSSMHVWPRICPTASTCASTLKGDAVASSLAAHHAPHLGPMAQA